MLLGHQLPRLSVNTPARKIARSRRGKKIEGFGVNGNVFQMPTWSVFAKDGADSHILLSSAFAPPEVFFQPMNSGRISHSTASIQTS